MHKQRKRNETRKPLKPIRIDPYRCLILYHNFFFGFFRKVERIHFQKRKKLKRKKQINLYGLCQRTRVLLYNFDTVDFSADFELLFLFSLAVFSSFCFLSLTHFVLCFFFGYILFFKIKYLL